MNPIVLGSVLTAADDVPPLTYLLVVAAALLLGAGLYIALRGQRQGAPPQAADLAAGARLEEAPPPEQATPVEPPVAPVEAAPAAPEAAPAALEAAPAAPEAAPAAPVPAADAGVVSIVPDPQTGEVAIVVGGQRYSSLLEVPEEQRPQVVRAVDNLIEFGLKTPGAPATGLVPRTPSTAPRLETGSRTITPRPATPDEYDEARRRHERIKRISSVAGSLIPGPQEPATPAFFDAINAIIARRIEENEELRGRRVSMHTTPEGDLQVMDGTQIFPSIDEVADDAVRAIIKAAIAEFEQGT